ncbi:hypothetical protein COCVIDRAFT_87710 [Bipolaris victoriae FI3]|uniref:Uncharacterized protein n=1 Tax=Bipolaris victoriae (strain FI3) TaxID=930091 RepID=W7EZQ2_BIPV3|nr:hypothetical protein COCVIDRAFT_87710 [Bipolaris victoriae FI3]
MAVVEVVLDRKWPNWYSAILEPHAVRQSNSSRRVTSRRVRIVTLGNHARSPSVYAAAIDHTTLGHTIHRCSFLILTKRPRRFCINSLALGFLANSLSGPPHALQLHPISTSHRRAPHFMTPT